MALCPPSQVQQQNTTGIHRIDPCSTSMSGNSDELSQVHVALKRFCNGGLAPGTGYISRKFSAISDMSSLFRDAVTILSQDNKPTPLTREQAKILLEETQRLLDNRGKGGVSIPSRQEALRSEERQASRKRARTEERLERHDRHLDTVCV